MVVGLNLGCICVFYFLKILQTYIEYRVNIINIHMSTIQLYQILMFSHTSHFFKEKMERTHTVEAPSWIIFYFPEVTVILNGVGVDHS